MREGWSRVGDLVAERWTTLVGLLVLVGAWRLVMATLRVLDPNAPPARPPRGRRASTATKGSMSWAVAKWLALAVLLAAATGYGLYRLLGRPSLPAAASFTTAELLDLLKIGLAVVGGLGAVVALVVGYRKQQVAEADHRIAAGQEERERTRFFNERYGKAAEQLGHDASAVRLAGVYAMAGLADDWPAQRQTCVDVLCGYLRMPYPEDRSERQVRQAIVATLLDHRWDGAPGAEPVTLDFRSVEFDDLDLSGRTFRGGHNFDHAVFRGRLTDLTGTTFHGTATFRHARFESTTTLFTGLVARRCELDFGEATFSGALVDFSGALLTRAALRFTGVAAGGTEFGLQWVVGRGCVVDFGGATLDGVVIDLSDTALTGTDHPSHASRVSLGGATGERVVIRLSRANLTEVVLDARDANLPGVVLEADRAQVVRPVLTTGNAEPAEFGAALRRLAGVGNADRVPDAPTGR